MKESNVPQRPDTERNFPYDLLFRYAAHSAVSAVDRGFPVIAHYKNTTFGYLIGKLNGAVTPAFFQKYKVLSVVDH